MMQIILIGISAGAAAALLFASLFSGSLLTLLLIYVLPLPILIASIGWGHFAGAFAALFAAACIAMVYDGTTAMAHVIYIGLPGWWLGYLALLARPAQAPGEALEWYPPGQVVLWAVFAGIASSIAILFILFGPDFDSIKANLRVSLGAFLNASGRQADADKLVELDTIAKIAPAAMAWGLTSLLIANTWLAAHIVKLSGQLRRPWPDLAAMRFPTFTPLIVAAALAGVLLPGLPGMISATATGALIVGFAVLGLAVLHTVTRGIDGRIFILGGVYGALIFFVWPALFLTLLGLADTALDLRGRSTATRGPPPLQ